MSSSRLNYSITLTNNILDPAETRRTLDEFITITRCKERLAEDILRNVKWDISDALDAYFNHVYNDETEKRTQSPTTVGQLVSSDGRSHRSSGSQSPDLGQLIMIDTINSHAMGSTSSHSNQMTEQSAQLPSSRNRSTNNVHLYSHSTLNRSDRSSLSATNVSNNYLSNSTQYGRQSIAQNSISTPIRVNDPNLSHQQNQRSLSSNAEPCVEFSPSCKTTPAFNSIKHKDLVKILQQTLRTPSFHLRIDLPYDQTIRTIEIDANVTLHRLREMLIIEATYLQQNFVFRRANDTLISRQEERLPISHLNLINKFVKIRLS